MKKDIKIL